MVTGPTPNGENELHINAQEGQRTTVWNTEPNATKSYNIFNFINH